MKIALFSLFLGMSGWALAAEYKLPAKLVIAKNGAVVEEKQLSLVFTEPAAFGETMMIADPAGKAKSEINYFIYEQLPLLKKNFQFIFAYRDLFPLLSTQLPKTCNPTAKARLHIAKVGPFSRLFGEVEQAGCEGFVLHFCMNRLTEDEGLDGFCN